MNVGGALNLRSDVISLIKILSHVAGLQEASGKAGVPAAEFEAFLQFASVFFGNMGNYLSFGMFLRFVS